MKQLTIEELKNFPRDSIFATGVVKDTPKGINMANTGKDIRWVATTGGIGDWAIYCHFAIYSPDYIFQHGDKVHSEKHIRKLMPCTDEAMQMYRH